MQSVLWFFFFNYHCVIKPLFAGVMFRLKSTAPKPPIVQFLFFLCDSADTWFLFQFNLYNRVKLNCPLLQKAIQFIFSCCQLLHRPFRSCSQPNSVLPTQNFHMQKTQLCPLWINICIDAESLMGCFKAFQKKKKKVRVINKTCCF